MYQYSSVTKIYLHVDGTPETCWYVVGLLWEGFEGALSGAHSGRVVPGVYPQSAMSRFNSSELGEDSEAEKRLWEQHGYRSLARARRTIHVCVVCVSFESLERSTIGIFEIFCTKLYL